MGHGECIMTMGLARMVVDRLRGSSAQEAADGAISEATSQRCECGIIVIDRSGRIGIAFNTEGMAYASMQDDRLDSF
jgi:isoaspartyl peptidase/L-asparaginase-like protein (Ntn-hydrolase superfamily)